jgi:hypothetical protein
MRPQGNLPSAFFKVESDLQIRQGSQRPYGFRASPACHPARDFVTIEEFPQSLPNLTEAAQNLYELVTGESSRGWRLDKLKQATRSTWWLWTDTRSTFGSAIAFARPSLG